MHMASALNSGLSSPGLSPGGGHYVEFLGKTLDSHIMSLHPVVRMETSKFNAVGNLAID